MSDADLQAGLKPFFDNNPKATFGKTGSEGKEQLAVLTPWGDTSLALVVSTDPEPIREALNAVILPERLSAIYHLDSKSLEIAWTAYALSKANRDVWERAFDFGYQGKTYRCEFKRASDRLITIAVASRPIGPSDSNYRNLPSFSTYDSARRRGGEMDPALYGEPGSFWINDITLQEDDLATFLATLNFYMSYYDDVTPLVIIQPPQITKLPRSGETRYRHKTFPKTINSKALEPEILLFWTACQAGEPASRFLYAFRIIEHAAFFYVESTHRAAVRKVLMAPHALDDIGTATDQIIGALKAARMEDAHRFEKLVTQSVDPEILWEIIATNIDFFSAAHSFDGGFEIKPLVASLESKSEFSNSGIKSFCAAVRNIRNALSHGKEERSAAVIAPTKANQEKLRPWAALMVRAAGEVILYRDA